MKKLVVLCCLLAALSFWLVSCYAVEDLRAKGDDTQAPPATEQPGQEPEPDPVPELPAHTHLFGEWSVVRLADCATQGLEQRACECGELEQNLTPALSYHAYDAEGTCTVCNKSEQELRLAQMTLMLQNQYGLLYFDQSTGAVGYQRAEGEKVIFSKPHHIKNAVMEGYSAEEAMSHLVLDFALPEDEKWTHSSLRITDHGAGIWQAQATENGMQVTYSLQGQLVLPAIIERKAFEEKILQPMGERMGEYSRDFIKFRAYYNQLFYVTRLNGGETKFAAGVAEAYPITAEKNIDIYVLDAGASAEARLWLARMILEYCPSYTVEDLREDYAFLKYTPTLDPEHLYDAEVSVSFVMDAQGLTVSFTDAETGLETEEICAYFTFPYLRAQGGDDVSVLCEDKKASSEELLPEEIPET